MDWHSSHVAKAPTYPPMGGLEQPNAVGVAGLLALIGTTAAATVRSDVASTTSDLDIQSDRFMLPG